MLAARTRRFSRHALVVLGLCVAGAVVASLADGILRANDATEHLMLTVWVTDFRYLFEQGVYAATLFWVAASFLETRTVLSVGFDRIDAGTMAIQGPDDANTVWIGRQYGSRPEAEAVAAALQSRLQDARR